MALTTKRLMYASMTVKHLRENGKSEDVYMLYSFTMCYVVKSIVINCIGLVLQRFTDEHCGVGLLIRVVKPLNLQHLIVTKIKINYLK